MAVGDARFPPLLVVGSAEAARVGELKADDKIVRRAEFFPMRGDQRLAQLGDAGLVLLVDDELVRIGAAVGRTAMASPPQMSFAPLSPNRFQRRIIGSVTPPVVVPSQPSIG